MILGLAAFACLLLGGGPSAVAQTANTQTPTTQPAPSQAQTAQAQTAQAPRTQASIEGPTTAQAPIAQATPPTEYKIGPLDKLNILVFGVKDLSADGVQVDASGQIQLPLIGVIIAQGKTTHQLSSQIADLLNKGYLRDPQVSVVVTSSASQKITVEGAVTNAGVFEMQGRTTLLQAVAMAKGPTNRADLRHVAIFRVASGKQDRMVFDLVDIRAGKVGDPEVMGNDVVVLSESAGKSAFHEFVTDVGALAIFSVFHL